MQNGQQRRSVKDEKERARAQSRAEKVARKREKKSPPQTRWARCAGLGGKLIEESQRRSSAEPAPRLRPVTPTKSGNERSSEADADHLGAVHCTAPLSHSAGVQAPVKGCGAGRQPAIASPPKPIRSPDEGVRHLPLGLLPPCSKHDRDARHTTPRPAALGSRKTCRDAMAWVRPRSSDNRRSQHRSGRDDGYRQ